MLKQAISRTEEILYICRGLKFRKHQISTMQNELIDRNNRIDIADVLRGFAVMGITILHCIEHFNVFYYPQYSAPGTFFHFTDRAIWDSLFFTFGGKAYAIFALLFGFSFFIQDNNQAKRGKDFRLRFVWRLLLLFVIGNINGMFFTGEILVLYSIVGFVLVLTSRLSNKILIPLATILLLQPIECIRLVMEAINPTFQEVERVSGYYFGQVLEIQKSGNFIEMAKANLWNGQIGSLTWAWEHGRLMQTAALFIFGMLIGRMQVFVYSVKNMKFWGMALVVALLGYFPLAGLAPMLPAYIENPAMLFSANLITTSLSKFFFMLIMLSAIVLVFYSFPKVERFLMKLAPYGRMSLTNYLSQSVIGAVVFYGWGLGLYDDMSTTTSFVFGIGLFVAQLLFCQWWMKSHKQGPLEYLWKKATWIGSGNKS